jgi:hypothetical protein
LITGAFDHHRGAVLSTLIPHRTREKTIKTQQRQPWRPVQASGRLAVGD